MEAFLDSLPVVSVSQQPTTSGKPTNQARQGGQNGNRERRSGARAADPEEVANVSALMRDVCPCTVMAHSAAGTLATAVLQADPSLFEALVLLEPVGVPANPSEIGLEAGALDVLALHGDRIEERNQTRRYDAVSKFIDALGESGQFLSLPDEGIYGSTHLYMIDKNSDEVLGYILQWMRAR